MESDIRHHPRLRGSRGKQIVFAVLLSALLIDPVLAHEHSENPGQLAEEPMQHDHSTMTENGYTSTVAQYQLPAIDLIDTDGNHASLAKLLDSDTPLMLNLIFTTCTAICPVMSATFEQVRNELGPKRDMLRMVSISIDPEHDTPARLKEYALKYHADPLWNFFTGASQEITELQRSLQAYRGNKMNHIPVTYLRASSSSPWIRIEGFANAKDLIHEYQQAVETYRR